MHTAAVIGLGVMGANHLRILSSMNDVRVVAICDPVVRPSVDIPRFDSVETLLETVVPDFAVVAVPTPRHLAIARQLARRGVGLLIEKPVTATAAEARALLEDIRVSGVKSAVGHVERFNPVVASLKRELTGKEIFTISFTRVGHLPPRIGDVGVLTDLAVHDIDLLHYITGRKVVSCVIHSVRKIHNHHEDCANVSFELDGDVLATITTNWLTPFKRRKIEVTAQEGYYEADLIAQELREYSAYKDDDTFLTRPCAVRKGEPLVNELTAMAAYMASGQRGELASVEDSLRTLDILESARSAAHG